MVLVCHGSHHLHDHSNLDFPLGWVTLPMAEGSLADQVSPPEVLAWALRGEH